jgi:hypothetical protein
VVERGIGVHTSLIHLCPTQVWMASQPRFSSVPSAARVSSPSSTRPLRSTSKDSGVGDGATTARPKRAARIYVAFNVIETGGIYTDFM